MDRLLMRDMEIEIKEDAARHPKAASFTRRNGTEKP
jgi:hypothetical protein